LEKAESNLRISVISIKIDLVRGLRIALFVTPHQAIQERWRSSIEIKGTTLESGFVVCHSMFTSSGEL
jgi:hypothetical protein